MFVKVGRARSERAPPRFPQSVVEARKSYRGYEGSSGERTYQCHAKHRHSRGLALPTAVLPGSSVFLGMRPRLVSSLRLQSRWLSTGSLPTNSHQTAQALVRASVAPRR
jgi:hypothetical protein